MARYKYDDKIEDVKDEKIYAPKNKLITVEFSGQHYIHSKLYTGKMTLDKDKDAYVLQSLKKYYKEV